MISVKIFLIGDTPLAKYIMTDEYKEKLMGWASANEAFKTFASSAFSTRHKMNPSAKSTTDS
jgi:hypothetical protein